MSGDPTLDARSAVEAVGTGLRTARPARLRDVLSDIGPLPIVLLAVTAVVASIEPRFASRLNLENVARQSAVLAILAFGQAFPILTGGFDISVGSAVAFTSIITGLVILKAGTGVGIFAGILFAGFLGLVNGFIISRFRVPPFVVTLGMSSIARGGALTTAGGQVIYGLPASFAVLGQGTLFDLLPIPMVVAALAFLVCWFLLTRTPFGRSVYAIGGNEEAARFAGIDVGLVKMLAYAVNGLLVGVGAVVLTSRVGSGEPNLGLGSELETIAAVVIGGVALGGGQGSLWGVAIGVITLSLLSNSLNLLRVSTYTQLMVIGAVIIVATVVDQLRHSKRPYRRWRYSESWPGSSESTNTGRRHRPAQLSSFRKPRVVRRWDDEVTCCCRGQRDHNRPPRDTTHATRRCPARRQDEDHDGPSPYPRISDAVRPRHAG